MPPWQVLAITDGQQDVTPVHRLLPNGFELSQCAYSAGTMRSALEGAFDLILLDCRVERDRAIQICRGLRAVEELSATPIVVLTGADDPTTRVAALEAGADDCLSESLGAREFILLVQAAVRRAACTSEARRLSYADVELDLERFKVRRGGATIYLPGIQFRLLRHFLEYPTVVFSRRQLLEQVWKDTSIDERSVNVAIVRLRRAINSHGRPNLIRSVPRLGYALDVDADV